MFRKSDNQCSDGMHCIGNRFAQLLFEVYSEVHCYWAAFQVMHGGAKKQALVQMEMYGSELKKFFGGTGHMANHFMIWLAI